MSWLARRVITVAITSIRDVDAPALSRVVETLPADERDRAQRFRHDDDRARFVVGRLLLRDLAAQALGVGADSVRIGAEESGRPVVAEPQCPLFVSLAHSGRYVVAAVARRPVGVDVEERRAAPTRPEVVARVCSPAERNRLDSLSATDRERAFMAVWARKEAYGKALGVGIGFELRAVTVGPTGRRVRGVPGRWQVVDLDVASDYAGAVVTAGRARVASRRIDAAVLVRR